MMEGARPWCPAQQKLCNYFNMASLDPVVKKAELIFYELQKAWAKRNLSLIRAYETDALYETHLYWIQEYRKQKLLLKKK